MKRRKYNKSVYRSLVMITQFGFNMLVPIFLCTFAGIWLDKQLGTSFLMLLLFFMGALAGFLNIYRMAKDIYRDEEQEQNDGNGRNQKD